MATAAALFESYELKIYQEQFHWGLRGSLKPPLTQNFIFM